MAARFAPLPVFVRVGDGPEHQIGTLTLEAAACAADGSWAVVSIAPPPTRRLRPPTGDLPLTDGQAG